MDKTPKCKAWNFETTIGKQKKSVKDTGIGNAFLNGTNCLGNKNKNWQIRAWIQTPVSPPKKNWQMRLTILN
jgi:hypothetical protein